GWRSRRERYRPGLRGTPAKHRIRSDARRGGTLTPAMDGLEAETVRAIIVFLGDVGPEHQGATKGNTIPLEWFRWLSADAVQLFYDPLSDAHGSPSASGTQRSAVLDREYGERLA